MKYKIAEKFISINGEGVKAGQTAVFIRLCGCNLNCSYCDTAWVNEPGVSYTEISEVELAEYVRDTGIHNVTLTGGEPLLYRENEDVETLLRALLEVDDVNIEIETNGSVDLTPFMDISDRITFTMDYKLPDSGMEDKMSLENFNIIRSCDTVKFVSGSVNDLKRAKEIIDAYRLTEKCHVYISPVFGNIAPVRIVDFMIENKINDVNLQLQLHKIIWDPEKRGV